jgi:hypothetical protein
MKGKQIGKQSRKIGMLAYVQKMENVYFSSFLYFFIPSFFGWQKIF